MAPRRLRVAEMSARQRRVLQARRSWPPVLLARLLGCHRATVYRWFPRLSPVPTEEVLRVLDRGLQGSAVGRAAR